MMNQDELRAILARGEDSRHQFKRDFNNVNALAAELIAFANRSGGYLLIGVDDGGEVTGLTPQALGRLNQLLSNAASQNVKPPINPTTCNVQTEQGLVMVIEVAEGLNKPYVVLLDFGLFTPLPRVDPARHPGPGRTIPAGRRRFRS